jgi:hypothetical protein
MPKTHRVGILEVTLIPGNPSPWEWWISAGGEVVMSGYEQTREEAKTEANSASFLLLANGWQR